MRWRDWLSGRLAALAVAVAVLVLGGSVRWVQAIVTLVMVAALAPTVMSRRVLGRLSPLVALLAIAVGLCLIQLTPLPHAVIALLSPAESGLRDDGLELMHLSARSTITFDVPGTVRALAYFLVLLGIAILALRTSTTERGRFRVLAIVAAICAVAALVTGINYAFGIRSLYGLLTPTNGPHIVGPLFNLNHLACLMSLGTCCAGALAMYRKQRPWVRVLWLVIAGMCALSTLATLSRGGALGLGAGAFVTVAILVAQNWWGRDGELPRHRASVLTSSLPIAVVAACTVVVVLYAGSGGVAQQFSQTSFTEIDAPRSKFAAWRSATTLIDESPWVGVGRGAFEPVFTRVHAASGYSTFSHVENEYLQAVVDFGIPGAIALGLAAIWLVVIVIRRWRDGPLAAGALGALVVVALQSNVDYGVEILGIAMPITAVIATLAYVPLRESSGARELTIRRSLRIAHVLALLTSGILLCTSRTASLDEDHVAFGDQHNLTLDQIRAPAERHPLDYFNYALAAQVMIKDRDRDAISMLNHAMTLHPSHSGLHLIAAHLLIDTRHPEQAAIEYSLALPASKHQRDLVTEIARRFPTMQAADALPTVVSSVEDISGFLLDLKRDDVARLWLDHVLDLHPQYVRACDLLFGIAVRSPDVAEAIIGDRRCRAFEPSHDIELRLARTLLDKRRFEQAARLVAHAETWATDEKVDGWLLLCDAEAGQEHFDEARQCLHRLEVVMPPDRMSELARRIEQLTRAQNASKTGADAEPSPSSRF